MIYAIVGLISVILFLALMALPFVAAERVGSWLARRYGAYWLRVALPLGLAAISVAWVIACYQALSGECKRAPQIERAATGSLSPFTGSPCRLHHRLEYLCSIDFQLPSSHAMVQLPAAKTPHWWAPPLVYLELRVVEKATGRVTASAIDVVFGGGLVGPYMRLLGGDQDFEYVSCGYASPDIGPWRPSLASRPRFTQYSVADYALAFKGGP